MERIVYAEDSLDRKWYVALTQDYGRHRVYLQCGLTQEQAHKFASQKADERGCEMLYEG